MPRCLALALCALAACPTSSTSPHGGADVGVPPDASLPFLLEAKVFDNNLSLERGWLRTTERCPSPDAGGADGGCETAVVALLHSTLSPCPDEQNNYRAVEVYLTRWTPGTYTLGTADPVTVKFVRKQQSYYREERQAASGTVTLTECSLSPARCKGLIDVVSAQGDSARGALNANQTCAAP